MTNTIKMVLNELYLRNITTREQLLSEILRVKITSQAITEQPIIIKQDKEKLFQLMKTSTEKELGFFPADRDDFYEIFHALEEIDIIDFTLEIYKNDRLGVIISPKYLTSFIRDRIKNSKPSTILITEAEKHLAGLKELVNEFSDTHITLTTQHQLMNVLLKFVFKEYARVKIIFESIYSNCLIDLKFDYIFSMPNFGYKPDEIGIPFMTKDSDGIALENMLTHLDEDAVLEIILPAKITFAVSGYEKLRDHITKHYHIQNIYILPEGTFRPTTAVKTYLLSISNRHIEKMEVGALALNQDKFEATDVKSLTQSAFLKHQDWRIELLLSEDDENIQKFKHSPLEKIKLKEVAEVFRGKSILKKDTKVGNIGVLNISNVNQGEIDYSDMDSIDEDERKIRRYQLEDGDVVLACRGTAIKSAVFTKQQRIIIASANFIVIRPLENETGKKVLGDYIKIFFESPTGLAIIKSFQRGTNIMNINHADIMEMEIPLLDLDTQQQLIQTYEQERQQYSITIQAAETRWNQSKTQIYSKLQGGS